MKVTLLYNTPLWVAAHAIRHCWQSHEKSDTTCDEKDNCNFYYASGIEGHKDVCYSCSGYTCGINDKKLIDRIGNKHKHSSTLEHLVYSFDIINFSRAVLQELSRHRLASPSVKSTRYTLKELKEELPFDTNEQESFIS